MKAIDRIFQLIDKQGVSVYKFERAHDISGGYLNRVKKNETYLGEQILVEILNKNSDLSAEWLMRGEGEMMKGQPVDMVADVEYYRDIIRQKDERINELTNTIISMVNKD